MGKRGLVIVDITDPAAPALAGQYPLSHASRIIVSEGWAYVTTAPGGDASFLHVLDLEDPIGPQPSGSLPLNWLCRDVTREGSLLYLTCERQQESLGGLVIVDISTPQRPWIAGTAELPLYARCAGVEGDLAVVQSRYLTTVDVSDPGSPKRLGQTQTSVSAEAVCVRDGFAFTAAHTHGLQIFNVSDPTTADYVATAPYPGNPEDIVIDGKIAYAVDALAGFLVLDIADPMKPEEIARRAIPASETRRKLDSEGLFAYVATGGLQIIDLTDPSDPQPRGYAPLDEPPFAYNVRVAGGYAYLGTSAGIKIYDIGDPDDPVLRNTLFLDEFSSYLAVTGGFLYIGSSEFAPYDSWLNVLDLADPVHPELTGRVGIPFGHGMVEVVGDRAYVSGHDYAASFLSVVDVAHPADPRLMGTEPFPNSLYDFILVGQIGYGAAPYFGLSLFSVADPADPEYLCNIPLETGGLCHTVVELGDHICVGAAGLSYALPHCEVSSAEENRSPALAPQAARLMGARPNPFSGGTAVDFVLAEAQDVRIRIVDVSGRDVITLCDRRFGPGRHAVAWNGRNARGRPAGASLYLIHLEGPGKPSTGKVWLLR
ncbi:MAG: hypothetical protein GF355_13975, partial [Candidatus Eisenbacteria bacterium]|nr:hypothetical protein [Candidatus Eisenbacteria bacterium]